MSFFTECPTVLIAQENKTAEKSVREHMNALEPGIIARSHRDESADEITLATNDIYRLLAELHLAFARLEKLQRNSQ